MIHYKALIIQGVLMKNLKIIAASVLLATSLGAAAASASLNTRHVDGGTWEYGVAGNKVHSNYFHPRHCHYTTAEGSYIHRSPNRYANQWSWAEAPARWWWADKAYYSFC